MLKRILFIIITLFLIGVTILLSINITIIVKGNKNIIDKNHAQIKADAIIVLGASVRKDQTPSPMLEDRIIEGVDVYNKNLSNKIIMSGDHQYDDYDEVTIMKNYAKNLGVKSEDIYLDHYGINTYESLYRAKNTFELQSVIIVTQEYHLYRALYIAEQLGLEAYGVSADRKEYSGQTKRDIREIAARIKAAFTTKIKKEPKYTGDKIDINESGDLTNERD